jgi:hypothetical protein
MKADHFPERLAFRAPAGLNEALEVAARRKFTTPSEWTRQTLLARLKAEGVPLPPREAEHA